jgi:DNA-binding transcriptional LysR family regulator
MKIFVTVCECDSVTAAAEKLFLAQPSVSLAIRELEEYYGVKLFDRISRKLYITEVGKQFLNYATHIVSLFDEMEKEVKNWDNIGTLRVGSSITIGTNLLPSFVKLFKNNHPNIKVQVVIDNSQEIEKRVITNEIDFGLIEGNPHHPGIHSEKFMDDQLVVIAGKDHPITKKEEVSVCDLKHCDFILREKGSGGRELFDSTMLIHDIVIEPIWESVSTRAIIQGVSEGLGLSVLPYLLVKMELDHGIIQTINVSDISFQRQFNVIYHKNKFLTKSILEFLEICKDISK